MGSDQGIRIEQAQQADAPSPSPISLRAYARHRGIAPVFIVRAVKKGRLKDSVVFTPNGVPKISSIDLADREWEANAPPTKPPAPTPAASAAVPPSSPSASPQGVLPELTDGGRQSESRPRRRRAPGPQLLTRRQLAIAMSVHPQTVTKWELEGMPIAEHGGKGRPSRYNEVEVRDWYQMREAAKRGPGAPKNFLDARAEREHWQAKLAEQTHAMRRRELIPQGDVERAWADEVAAMRAVLLASYTAHADRVFRAATVDGLFGVEEALKEIAYEALRELANPGRALPSIEEPGDGADAASNDDLDPPGDDDDPSGSLGLVLSE